MKNVILTADGSGGVYSVPDEVADRLYDFCLYFLTDWWNDHKERYFRTIRGHTGYFFNEEDFIDYLNEEYPDEPSVFVEEIDPGPTPEKYADCPHFEF